MTTDEEPPEQGVHGESEPADAREIVVSGLSVWLERRDAAWPCADRLSDLCARAVSATVAAGCPVPEATLSVVLASDAAVRAENAAWRGKDAPTNVLSFPACGPAVPGEPPHLGDLMLAGETVAAEARAEGKPLDHHVLHLLVHGLLHLLGHDHERDAEAERMEALETVILARLGVPDPYGERAA